MMYIYMYFYERSVTAFFLEMQRQISEWTIIISTRSFHRQTALRK